MEQHIKMALDAGPDGIIVPLINSHADARTVVEACCYPPRGSRRGTCQFARSSRWGMDEPGRDSCCMVFCQVETPEAVEVVDEILAVDGIDGMFVSSLDLASALGHPGIARGDLGSRCTKGGLLHNMQ